MTQAEVVRIEADVSWEVTEDRDSGLWIGVCEDLHLSAHGDTFAEFQECVLEVMDLLFQDLREEGDLAKFLEDRGWRTPATIASVPADVPLRFDIPYAQKVVSASA